MLTITPRRPPRRSPISSRPRRPRGQIPPPQRRRVRLRRLRVPHRLHNAKPADKILPQAGFDVIVDAESLKFIADATIDYSEDETSSGFKIKNPQEKGSCGCGKSKQF